MTIFTSTNAWQARSVIEKTETPRFPLQVMRSLAQPLQQLADGTAAHVDYAVATFLTLVAGLIGNTRVVKIHSRWTEPCALWVLLIGLASSAKSSSMRAVTQFTQRIEAEEEEKFRRECQLHEGGEVSELPRRTRIMTTDTSNVMLVHEGGHNPRGQIIASKEGAPFLTGANNKFLEAFNGESITYSRATTGTVHCERLLASCIGAVHPCDIEKQIVSRAGDGGLARCLVTEPERRPFSLPDDLESNPDLSPIFRALHAIPLGEGPEPVTMDEKGRNALEAWVRTHEQEELGGAIDLHFAKMRGIAPRLALVLDYAWAAAEDRPFPTTLSWLAVAGSLGLLEQYFKPMARKVYRVASQSGASKDAQTLAQWILSGRPACINKREVYKDAGLPGLSQPAAVQSALDELVHFGWLRRAPEKAGAGRKPEDYAVNPAVFDLPEAV